MKTKFITTLVILAIGFSLNAQNVAISEDNSTPDPSAMLDVQSTDKGMLIPRMTLSERISITNPAEGLTVYQTNDVKGFYYYDGSQWTAFINTSQITDFGSGEVITDTERSLVNSAVQTETDPVFTAHPANGVADAGSGQIITDTERGLVNTALQSESDPVFTAHPANSITHAGSGEVITDSERTKLSNDDDGDSNNEIQDLDLDGNILTITSNSSPEQIDLTPYLDGKWNETAEGIKYQTGNYTIEINANDTVFKIDGGVETDNQHGKDIVLKAGTTNSSTDNLNGGNIIMIPGEASGTGNGGKVEVQGEIVTQNGFFQYRGENSTYDFKDDNLLMDNLWHEMSLNGIVPDEAKAIYVNLHFLTNDIGSAFTFNESETTYTKIYIQSQDIGWSTCQFLIPVSENNSIFYRINNTCNCIDNVRGIIIGWWK